MKTKMIVAINLLGGILVILAGSPCFSNDPFYWMGEFVGYGVQKAIGSMLFLLPGVSLIFTAGKNFAESKVVCTSKPQSVAC